MEDMTPTAAPDGPGVALKAARARAGKTIRQVAADLGVAERTYIRWEQGDCSPDAANLIGLADYFEVDPRTLVPEPTPVAPEPKEPAA